MLGLVCHPCRPTATRARPARTFVRMARFTAALVKPDGTAPQIGDNDGGRVLNFLDRPPLEHRYLIPWARRVCGEDRPILEATDGQLLQFAQSGITRVQLGQTYLVLAATPVGQQGSGGHGHNDKLSLELFHRGNLITDSGTYAYTSNLEARNAFRSTSAHATLQIDDLEQNPIPEKDAFHLPERAHAAVLRCELEAANLVWEAEHKGFAPFIHRRKVTATATRILIVNSIIGKSSKPHMLSIRFPLAPDLVPKIEGRRLYVLRGEQRVLAFGSADAKWNIEPGSYSPDYGVRVDRFVLVARVRTKLPATVTIKLALPRDNPGKPGPTSRS